MASCCDRSQRSEIKKPRASALGEVTKMRSAL